MGYGGGKYAGVMGLSRALGRYENFLQNDFLQSY